MAGELFSLVASLTLDTSEYEQAIRNAEHQGQGNAIEAHAKITAVDEFTGAVESAEAAAAEFAEKGAAEGEITADDDYTGAVDEAQEAADDFDGDAAGTIDGTDDYSDEVTAAQKSATSFDGDVDGTISAEDDYSTDLETAETDFSGFDGDAEGDITADDDYSGALAAAEGSASSANDGGTLDVSGTISMDDGGIAGTFTAASDSAKAFPISVEAAMATAVGNITASGITGVIQGIARSFQNALSNTATYADTVDKTSRRMSMSTRAYQEWDHALQQSGASMADVQRGWLNMNKIAGHSEEVTDELRAAYSQLGMDIDNFGGTTEQLFSWTMRSLAQMNAGADRDNLVTAIFGRNGTQLNALLDSGVTGIEDLIREAQELGLIMSDEDISKGVAYGDALANMQAAVAALQQSLATGVMPILTQAMTIIAGIAGWLSGRTGEDTLLDTFSHIDESLAEMFADATVGQETTMSLIRHLRELSDESGNCTGSQEEWLATARRLIEICPALASHIDLESQSFNNEAGVLEANTQAWFDNMRARAIEQAMAQKQQAISDKLTKTTEKQVDMIAKQAEADTRMAMAREKLAEGIGKVTEAFGFDQEELSDLLANSGAEGYSFDEVGNLDLSGMDFANLKKLAEFMGSVYGAENEDIFESLGGAIDDISKAQEAMNKVSELASEISAAQTELEGAIEEYNVWRGVMEETMSSLQSTSENAATAQGEVAAVGAAADAAAGERDITFNVTTNGEIPVIAGTTVDAEHNAKGLDYVPYDDYLTTLHRGEAVLSGNEARAWRDSGGRGQEYGDTGAIVAAIQSLGADMANLKLVVGQRAFGGVVVDYGGRGMNNYLGEADSRRRRGYGST